MGLFVFIFATHNFHTSLSPHCRPVHKGMLLHSWRIPAALQHTTEMHRIKCARTTNAGIQYTRILPYAFSRRLRNKFWKTNRLQPLPFIYSIYSFDVQSFFFFWMLIFFFIWRCSILRLSVSSSNNLHVALKNEKWSN